MPLSRLSIKHQLFVIVTIIALPTIFIIVTSGVLQRRNNIHDAKRETQALAEAIVSVQSNLIASTRQLFIALSKLPAVTTRNEVEVNRLLSEILKLSPQYLNIFIADPSGVVWASAVPLTDDVSVADRHYFQKALASGRLSSGDYEITKISKLGTLCLGYPLKDDAGKVTAVIGVSLSLEHYGHILDSYSLPKGASFALLDHAGIILYRAVDSAKYLGKQSSLEILHYMQEGPEEETSIGTSSVVADTRIQTYRKLRLEGEATPYMYVRVGIPADIVMAEGNAALGRNLLIYSLSLLCAYFLSWFIGKKYIISKIMTLKQSAQRLADGDLNARVAHQIDGGEIGMLGQAFDDMAQKLATREQALLESESNYRGIFNTAHDALIVNDESGRILEANKSSEVMFGYTRKELLQMSVEALVSGEPSHSFSEAILLMEKCLQEGTQEFEWKSRKKNGELFWSEIAITPTSVFGERRILAVIRDITERKEIEYVKETMLSTVSHEMRSPLTAMLGFLDLAIENKVEEAELKEYHTIMQKEGERLNETITNFLDMQRLKSKLDKNNFKPLEIRPLLEEVAAIYGGPSAKHSIIVRASSSLPQITGDEELLHQALGNFLSNAIKYSPEGSEIVLDARMDGTSIILWVKDEGIGIPFEFHDKIFDMFYRVDDACKQRIAGTGLGLALVKEIVSAHNGQLWLESIVGQGSTFYISLPLDAHEL